MKQSTDAAPTDDLPSLVTALQDQLGLKLERRRVTEDVVVVDRIEHPTPDWNRLTDRFVDSNRPHFANTIHFCLFVPVVHPAPLSTR